MSRDISLTHICTHTYFCSLKLCGLNCQPLFYSIDKSFHLMKPRVAACIWASAVSACSLYFLLVCGLWVIHLIQAIVSTSTAAFWKQAFFCSGHLGSKVGCHGTAAPVLGARMTGRRRMTMRRKHVAAKAVCNQETNHSEAGAGTKWLSLFASWLLWSVLLPLMPNYVDEISSVLIDVYPTCPKMHNCQQKSVLWGSTILWNFMEEIR